MAFLEIDSDALETIRLAQNPDGGFPYRKGGSWTEPTVYALLAHQAAGRPLPRLADALAWLESAQRSDGGFTPRRSVEQTTWVTALVALLPPESIGAAKHARAIHWLLEQSGRESSPIFRWRELVLNGKLPDGPDVSGWPWFPGTAAWVTPTCIAILALKKSYARRPTDQLRDRIAKAQSFLLSRRCADGGWNHGSAKALGYNSDSYPETTGQALLALSGTDPQKLNESFNLAQHFLKDHRAAAGVSWLRLGLQAHRQLPSQPPQATMPCRTLPDTALKLIAEASTQGQYTLIDK